MNNPSHLPALEELTAKIVRAVPEIMELKFGCLLKPKIGECTFMFLAQTKDHIQVLNTWKMEFEHIGTDGNPIQWCWKKKGANKDIITFDERFEILGRPITWEDVMIALDKSEDGHNIGITAQGMLIIVHTPTGDDYMQYEEIGDDNNSIVIWKPGVPLHLQTPETIAFLNDLLPSGV